MRVRLERRLNKSTHTCLDAVILPNTCFLKVSFFNSPSYWLSLKNIDSSKQFICLANIFCVSTCVLTVVSSLWFPLVGREELLTEHASAWNRRKIVAMADALCAKFVKVQ